MCICKLMHDAWLGVSASDLYFDMSWKSWSVVWQLMLFPKLSDFLLFFLDIVIHSKWPTRVTVQCSATPYARTFHFMQEWSGAIGSGVDLRPSPRSFHTAVCLHDPQSVATPTGATPPSQKLLVLWGMDQQAEPINDIWLLDVKEMKWSQVSFLAT